MFFRAAALAGAMQSLEPLTTIDPMGIAHAGRDRAGTGYYAVAAEADA